MTEFTLLAFLSQGFPVELSSFILLVSTVIIVKQGGRGTLRALLDLGCDGSIQGFVGDDNF